MGLRRLHGTYTGENQSWIIFGISKEYNLIQKVGYFTLDNTRNNDKALSFLGIALKEDRVYFDPIESRLQCLSHTINLVVKVFLYSIDLKVVNIDNQDAVREDIVQ